MKKKILIVFVDEWAAYSPTLQNLVTVLDRDGRFEVTALYGDNGRYSVHGLDPRLYERVALPSPEEAEKRARSPWSMAGHLKRRLNSRLFPHEHVSAYTMEKLRVFAKKLVGRTPDHVIAIDPVAMTLCAALFDSVTFLSLEVLNEIFLRWIEPSRFHGVVIQNPERYALVFPQGGHRTFWIQNSHLFEGRSPREFNRSIVYFGNIAPTHGMEIMVDAMRALPEFTLTMKGILTPAMRARLEGLAGDLLASGRIMIEDGHIEQSDTAAWLRKFGLGFCFYDIAMLRRSVLRRDARLVDHYLNCPSGKLFNYYAAGLPVVGSEIPGLASVSEHTAGILLGDCSASAVAESVRRIAADYERFVKGSFAAAEANDFATLARPFADALAAVVKEAPGSAATAFHHSIRLASFLKTFDERVRSPVPAIMGALRRRIESRPLVVYGAGLHTEWLMKEGLGDFSIAALADSDSKKWGSRFLGYEIVSPERIADFAEDVLISSYEHEAVIAKTVRELFGDRVRIHRFYADHGVMA